MTGLLHEREFSRKAFVKGGGALVVGFSLGGAGMLPAKASAASSAAAGYNPNPNRVDTWIAIHPDNTVSLMSGRVELGQGSGTGLLMMAAEELNVHMSQMQFVRNDTHVTPNSGETSASSSISLVGGAVRTAAATAHQTLLRLASTRLGVPVAKLSVRAGVVSGGGKSVTYGELLGGKLFHKTMPAKYDMGGVSQFVSTVGLAAGQAPAKPASSYTLVGTSVPRIDIPAIAAGTFTYVQNLSVPGMLNGRVVRPRGQGAYGTDAPIISIDESSVSHIPGVRVIRKRNFVGVVAPLEWDAIQAAAQLKVVWKNTPALPGSGNLWRRMRSQGDSTQSSARFLTKKGDVETALTKAAHTVSQTYATEYYGHLPIGPTCVIADVRPGSAMFYSNVSSVYELSQDLAPLLRLPASKIRVQFWEGSSAYGSGAPFTDAAQAAGLMSQIVGKPVRVQFMRWDEHGWDNYTPPEVMDIRGAVDHQGKIVAYDHTSFAIPFITIGQGDTTSQLLGAAFPPPGPGDPDGESDTAEHYNIPNRRVTVKTLPLRDNYLKSQYIRTVAATPNFFGSEQMIDELAHAANMDPFEFRVKNFAANNGSTFGVTAKPNADRWQGIANALHEISNWQPKVAASNPSAETLVSGRGIAIAPYEGSYTGTVADIAVDKKSGKITVNHLYVAFDAGLMINPGLVENQTIGGNVQATSRALVEEVTFTRNRVTSLDWVSYPVLRFMDSPTVTTKMIQRTDQPSTGAGEPQMVATAPAIANAFFDATGVRIRIMPMTAPRVRAVLKAHGSGTPGVP